MWENRLHWVFHSGPRRKTKTTLSHVRRSYFVYEKQRACVVSFLSSLHFHNFPLSLESRAAHVDVKVDETIPGGLLPLKRLLVESLSRISVALEPGGVALITSRIIRVNKMMFVGSLDNSWPTAKALCINSAKSCGKWEVNRDESTRESPRALAENYLKLTSILHLLKIPPDTWLSATAELKFNITATESSAFEKTTECR